MNIRKKVFFLMDRLKGSPIKSRLNEIKKSLENDDYYVKTIDKKVEKILKYAENQTDFYKRYKGKALNEYPVINKNIINNNMDAFLAKKYKGVKTHKMSTSGSTGIPFKVSQNEEKRQQVIAEVLYFSGVIGYEVGKPFLSLKNLERNLRKPKIKQILQNEKIIATRTYGEKALEQITNDIISNPKGTTMLSYASTLNEVAFYMQKHNIKTTNITGIISGAEAITSKTRSLVENQFKCKVVSRYSNQEMGILAQEVAEDVFVINRSSYYIELLDLESDEPVELGEMGRIVVTDLYNQAMPLIRYDTGDLGILDKTDTGKEFLAKVYGRKLDLLYTTKDEPISFFVFDEIFESDENIQQFQVVQNNKNEIDLNLIIKSNAKIDEETYIYQIQSIMGNDCIVKINYIDVAPISRSGKFKNVICKYTPNNGTEKEVL